MRNGASKLRATKIKRHQVQRAASALVEAVEQRVLLSSSITTLATFSSSGPWSPSGTIVRDSSGTIYGIANNVAGQSNISGIYKLTSGSSTPTLVASFPVVDGFSSDPVGLVIDGNDNIFGVTSIGGDSTLDGTVFELAKGATTITTLAQFDQSTNGHSPSGNIVMNSAGDIFGVCDSGGTENGGTVWKFTKSTGTITQVAPFPEGSGADLVPGANSIAIDAAGDLFGTTGGQPLAGDFGSVWEVAAGQSTVHTLASFVETNGSVPTGPIVVDSSGNIFGVTQYGGANTIGDANPVGIGTVYEVVSGSNAITTLASFDGTTTGDYPVGGLVADGSGNLFGTATQGGTTTSQAVNGAGTVFEVVKGSKTITPLILFNGTDGGRPEGGLTLDSSGNIFGTSTTGDSQTFGNIFKITSGGGGGGTSGTFTATATVKSPATIVAGQKIAVSISSKLTNTGSTTASTGVAFAAYLSADGVVDNNSIALGDVRVAEISPIKAAQGITARATIKSIPVATPAGTYHYIVEYKNTDGSTTDFQSANTVTVAAPVINIGGSFAKFVGSAKTGKPLVETINVTNIGANVAASGTISIVAAFLATDGGITGGVPVIIKQKVSIKPGKSVKVPLKLRAPTTAGTYNVLINLSDSAITTATDSTFADKSFTSATAVTVS